MPNPPAADERPAQLTAALGGLSATAIVVGSVIGSGIFFKPSSIARDLGDRVGLILALWVACGLVNLCGALGLAELSAMFPRAGGTYVFLREAYGRGWAFVWVWAEFWVIRSGACAALAVYSAMSLAEVARQSGATISSAALPIVHKLLAVGAIVLLGAINAAGIIWGGRVQNALTAVKVATVAAIGLAPFVLPHAPAPQWGEFGSLGWPGWAGIGAALLAIMWAYDGWGNVTVVAEEIRQPQRNVPRALIAGVVILVLLYTGATFAYHWLLPHRCIAGLSQSSSVAVLAWQTIWPDVGPRLMIALLMVSTLGALNSNVLVGPRVLFAVARDHAAFARLARVNPKTHAPVAAIALMCGWSILLVLLGDLSPRPGQPLADVLTNYCVFGGSIFYFLSVLAVFVLRATRPEALRPYRTWGYPLTPAVFVSFYVVFLVLTLLSQPVECVAGLLLVALGAAAYAVVGRR